VAGLRVRLERAADPWLEQLKLLVGLLGQGDQGEVGYHYQEAGG